VSDPVDVAGLRQEAEKELIYLEAFSEHGETNARAAARLIRRLLDRLAAQGDRADALDAKLLATEERHEAAERRVAYYERELVWLGPVKPYALADADVPVLRPEPQTVGVLVQQRDALRDRLAAVERERDHWREDARLRAQNTEHAQAEVARLRAVLTDAGMVERVARAMQAADNPLYRWVSLDPYMPMARAALDAIARAGGA
jgi:hypothetical protein